MNPASSGSTLPPPSSHRSADLAALASATNWPSAPSASPSAAPVKLSSAVPVSKTAAAPAPLPSAAALSAVPVRRTSAEHAVLTSAVPSKEKLEVPSEALSGSVPQLDSYPSEARALGRQVSIRSNIIDE
jgi:hypothetical protein